MRHFVSTLLLLALVVPGATAQDQRLIPPFTPTDTPATRSDMKMLLAAIQELKTEMRLMNDTQKQTNIILGNISGTLSEIRTDNAEQKKADFIYKQANDDRVAKLQLEKLKQDAKIAEMAAQPKVVNNYHSSPPPAKEVHHHHSIGTPWLTLYPRGGYWAWDLSRGRYVWVQY